MTYRARRSVLYMPATNERALEKGKSLPADAIIFDLEDAVVPERKPEARDHLASVLQAGGYGPRELIVRVNGLDTPWGREDIERLSKAGPDAMLVPKVRSPSDVATAASLIVGNGGAPSLWIMVETARAILDIHAIAALADQPGTRLSCFVMGTNDLVKETGCQLDAARSQALYWFSATVTAAKAYGIEILDGVYNDFRDQPGFRRQCQQARSLGMDGATLIHPGQIDIANEIFSPSQEEIAWAERVCSEFAKPENDTKGAIDIDGSMVERLHLEMANRILARRNS